MNFVSVGTAGLDSLVTIALDDVGDRHRSDAVHLLVGSGMLGTPLSPTVLTNILILIAGPFDMEKHCASLSFPLRDVFPPSRWSDAASLGLELSDATSHPAPTFLDSIAGSVGGPSTNQTSSTPYASRRRRAFGIDRDDEVPDPLDATLPKLPLAVAAQLMDATLCALGVESGVHLFSDAVGTMHATVTGNVRIIRELLLVRAHRVSEARERLPSKVTSLLGTVGFLRQTRSSTGPESPAPGGAESASKRRLVTPVARERARSVVRAASAGRRSGGRSAVTRFKLQPPSVEEFTRNYLFLSLLSAIFCVDPPALKSLLRGVTDNARTTNGHGRSSFASIVVRNASSLGVALASCFAIEMLEGYARQKDEARSNLLEDWGYFLLGEVSGIDVSTTQYLRVVGALLSQTWTAVGQMGPAPQLEFVTSVSESLRQARSLRVKEVLLNVLGGTATCARHNCGGGCVVDGVSLRFALVDYLLQYQLAIKASNVHVKDAVKRYYEGAYEVDRARRDEPDAVHPTGNGDGRLTGSMAPSLARAGVMHLFIRPTVSRQSFSDCSNSVDVYALFMVTWASDAIALGVEPLPMPADGEWSPDDLTGSPEDPVELSELGSRPWENVNRVWFYRRVRHWLHTMRSACVGKIPWSIESEAMARFELAADLLCKAAGPLDVPPVDAVDDPDEVLRHARNPNRSPVRSPPPKRKRMASQEEVEVKEPVDVGAFDDDSEVHVVSSSEDSVVVCRDKRAGASADEEEEDDSDVDIGGGPSGLFSSSRSRIIGQLVEMGFARASAADAYDARAGTNQAYAIELQDVLDLLM